MTTLPCQEIKWESKTRYYIVRLYRDLLGHWVVTRAWGGLKTRLGGLETVPVPSYEAGLIAMGSFTKQRAARHYRVIQSTISLPACP